VERRVGIAAALELRSLLLVHRTVPVERRM
jgi:hypothetical protein